MNLPLSAYWLTAEKAAEMLGYDHDTFREKIAPLPGFPKPARIQGKRTARWNAAELDAYMREQRELLYGKMEAA